MVQGRPPQDRQESSVDLIDGVVVSKTKGFRPFLRVIGWGESSRSNCPSIDGLLLFPTQLSSHDILRVQKAAYEYDAFGGCISLQPGTIAAVDR